MNLRQELLGLEVEQPNTVAALLEQVKAEIRVRARELKLSSIYVTLGKDIPMDVINGVIERLRDEEELSASYFPYRGSQALEVLPPFADDSIALAQLKAGSGVSAG